MRSGQQTDPNRLSIGNGHAALKRTCQRCDGSLSDRGPRLPAVGKIVGTIDYLQALDTATKRRVVAMARSLGWPRSIFIATHLTIAALAVLCLLGQLEPVYSSLVRFLQPGVWSAMAGWATVGVALGAFVYAKRQVHEARQSRLSQEKHARESLDQQAELSKKSLRRQMWDSREALRQQRLESGAALRQQERAIDEQRQIAQESLNEQARQAQLTRDEMAQPNVVMYAEPNLNDWQNLEIVIKNFGSTPAYDVVPIIDPPLQSLPNNLTNGEFYTIPLPATIPILAPNQEWRTFWDDAVERKEYEDDIRVDILRTDPSASGTGVDLTLRIAERMPRALHTGSVRFSDRNGRIQTNDSVLDFNMLKGSMRMRTYGLRDIAKKYVKG